MLELWFVIRQYPHMLVRAAHAIPRHLTPGRTIGGTYSARRILLQLQPGLGLGLGPERAFIIIFCSLGKVKSATNMERKARNTRLKKIRPLVLPAANTVSDWPCCHHSSPAPAAALDSAACRLQPALCASLLDSSA